MVINLNPFSLYLLLSSSLCTVGTELVMYNWYLYFLGLNNIVVSYELTIIKHQQSSNRTTFN